MIVGAERIIPQCPAHTITLIEGDELLGSGRLGPPRTREAYPRNAAFRDGDSLPAALVELQSTRAGDREQVPGLHEDILSAVVGDIAAYLLL